MNKYFKVDTQWMQACGFGHKSNILEVVEIKDYSLSTYSTFFRAMVTVKHPLGCGTWQVAIGRGEFVTEE